MTEQFGYDSYLSPFTWRYGSAQMRGLWSEATKRKLWRRVWVALAEAQSLIGLVTPEQVSDLRANADAVDVPAALEAEKTLRHDLMAEIHVYAAQCKVGGGIIHLGATSMDIEDNAEALRLRDSLDVLLEKLGELLTTFSRRIEQYADTPTMAFTHLQPAEPTTVGYRLALYAQDLLSDFKELSRMRGELRGKGIKGAVGSSASYVALLDGRMSTVEFEREVMSRLGLEPFTAANQTYPRKQDYSIGAGLASLAGSLYKFSADVRLLQSPLAGEWAEAFEQGQVGSSAMPFKRNPINAEKVNSLGRLVAHLVGVLWDNAAHSYLERTLDDSANRRETLPTMFLAVDEMLLTTQRLLGKLTVDAAAVQRTLDRFGAFAATERVLMALGKAGADRQSMHARLRDHSMTAWAAIREGQPNPLVEVLSADATLHQYLSPETIRALMNIESYVGDAPLRARLIAAEIRLLSALRDSAYFSPPSTTA